MPSVTSLGEGWGGGAECVDGGGPGVALLCPLGLAFPLPAESLAKDVCKK